MTEAEKKFDRETTGLEVAIAEGGESSATTGSIRPKVHFSLWQTLGMNFSITATPIAIGVYTALIIGLGGFPFYIWALVVAAFFQLITCLAAAELASAIPHSSGPCFWVQHLAPPKYSRFLGYLTGWLTTALWWFLTAGASLFLSQLTLGAAQANNPGYQPPEWHYFLVYCAWATMTFLPNLPRLFKVLPYMLIAGVIIINATAIYLLVTLLVRATPKQSAHNVFVQVVNDSGWPSDGVVFFLALIPGLLVVSGFDSVTHITDELETPTKEVPQVMIGSALLSAVAALIMAIVYSFCAVDVANLLNPYGHQPMIQLIFDTTRSPALATMGSVLLVLEGYIAAVATFTSWNRLYWSFAREGGLPFSRAMSKLSTTDALPVNAMMVNFLLTLGLGAIQLGSLTALNVLAGSAVVCSSVTYSLAFGLLLWRGRNFLSSERWFALGRFGTAAYIIAMLWCMFITVWLCFPLYLPVTLSTMNWTSVVVVGISVLSIGYWFLFGLQVPPAGVVRA